LYKIFDTVTKQFVHAIIGAGSNGTQSEFNSIEEARGFNCHGLFKDKVRYKIYEYEVVRTLLSIDADPATKEDIEEYTRNLAKEKEINDEYYAWK